MSRQVRLDNGVILNGIPDSMTDEEAKAWAKANGLDRADPEMLLERSTTSRPTSLADRFLTPGNKEYALGLAQQAAEGATLNLSDEIAGLAMAGLSYVDPRDPLEGQPFMDRYRGIRDAARDREQRFRTENPGASIAARVGGGVLTGGLLSGPGAAAQVAQQVPGRVGSLIGAAASYGMNEDSSDVATLAGDVAKGTLLGGGLGYLSRPALDSLGNPLPLQSSPATYARRAMETKTKTQPERVIKRDMLRDEIDPAEAAAQLKKMPGGSILDVGGYNTKQTGEGLLSMPGRAANVGKQFLEGRNAGQGGRVNRMLERALHTKGGFVDAQDELTASLRTSSKPYYEAAEDLGVQATDDIAGLARRFLTSDKNVVTRAVRALQREGYNVKPVQNADDLAELLNNPRMAFRFLNSLKEEFDDAANAAFRKGANTRARNLRIAADAITDTVDDQMARFSDDGVSVYAKARQTWAGDKRMLNALEEGRKVLREDYEVIRKSLDSMTPGEQDMYRLGAARAIRDKILRKPEQGDATKGLFNVPYYREKLNELFPNPRDRAVLERGVRNEQTMFDTYSQAMSNSRTPRLGAKMQDLVTDPDNIATAATSGWKSGGLRVLREWWKNNHGAIKDEQVRNRIADIVFRGDEKQQADLLMQIMSREHATPPYMADPGTVMGQMSRMAGSRPGPLVPAIEGLLSQ